MTNMTFNGTNADYRYNTAEIAIISILLGSLALGSMFGNILTLVAYYKVKSLQRATNYLILSLASADIIVAVFVVNIHTMYMVLDWPYHTLNYQVCLLWLTVDYWVFQVSVFGVLLVTGDRYLSIKFPHRYRQWRTDRFVVCMIIANWVVSFLIWVPLILVYGYHDEVQEEMISMKMCDVGSAKVIPATVIGCLVSYVIPVFIMIAIAIDSVRILLKMKKTVNKKSIVTTPSTNAHAPIAVIHSAEGERCATTPQMDGHEFQDTGEEDYESTRGIEGRGIYDTTATMRASTTEIGRYIYDASTAINPVDMAALNKGMGKKRKIKNATRIARRRRISTFSNNLDEYQWIATFNMLLGITFVVNVFPFGVLAVTKSVCLDINGYSCVSTKWWYFGYIMCYLNSMLNPVCYAFGNKNFKRAFKLILCRKTQ